VHAISILVLRVTERWMRNPCMLKDMKLAFPDRFVREYGDG
jgi:hypothetical protein